MAPSETCLTEMILKYFFEQMQKQIQTDPVGEQKSIFIYHALKNNPEQEFIIDIEIDCTTKTAILYHIALPINMRNKGLGTRIVMEIEKSLAQMGLHYISLPAEHHSTGFWLKVGYQFKYDREQLFYKTNTHRNNLRVAYELEKVLAAS